MLFALICHDSPEAPSLRPKLRDQHMAHLKPLIDRGAVLLGGPFTDGSGALIVLDVENAQQAQAVVDGDPFFKGGVFSHVEVKALRKVVPNP